MIYGTTTYFISKGSGAPEVIAITPSAGLWGDTVEIKGQGFSYRKEENQLLFGELEAEITYSTDTNLQVLVPNHRTNETVKVTVATTGRWAENYLHFTYELP
ncbi:IPT/TIG domain-containing protein [Nafulsella turpanensis]|uniref:IPT/TIG domain-containing protein n=1 Tax=Nafulsella turpanensis TaxID=1265690 RepID=UPI001268D425|nr:IPT/TIG domain-containing protein [Nafulsella turpanensis]